jgi:thiamine-phosphate diphosphorylase
MATLAHPAVFLVTTGAATREDDEGWHAALDSASLAAGAGVDVVQVREPNLADRALIALVRNIIRTTSGSPTVVIVNNRADIAVAAGASGVHLRADGVSAARVRTIVPSGFLIGRSVHSLAEARTAAVEGGVDYLFFGTTFRSASKSPGHDVQGRAALASVCHGTDIPVIAIGGVTLQNVREAATAGAAGVAAIGLFAEAARWESGRMAQVTRELRAAFSKPNSR